MTGINLFERLGGRLPWVREHQRIRGATRSAIAASEADRGRIAVLLNALRLEIRRRDAPTDGDVMPGYERTDGARGPSAGALDTNPKETRNADGDL